MAVPKLKLRLGSLQFPTNQMDNCLENPKSNNWKFMWTKNTKPLFYQFLAYQFPSILLQWKIFLRPLKATTLTWGMYIVPIMPICSSTCNFGNQQCSLYMKSNFFSRINFYHPGAAVGKDGFRYATPPEATFLKELTYRRYV